MHAMRMGRPAMHAMRISRPAMHAMRMGCGGPSVQAIPKDLREVRKLICTALLHGCCNSLQCFFADGFKSVGNK